jgi:hypothetical protein
VFSIRDENKYGLCEKCNSSFITEDENGNVSVQCSNWKVTGGENNKFITKKIVKCNGFVEANKISYHEMSKIAWIIETKKGKPIGFISPQEAKEKKLVNNDDDF